MTGLEIILAKMFVGAVVVAVFAITFSAIINWFKSRRKLKLSDKDNIAFTLKQEKAKGEYVVFQGIFHEKTGIFDTEELLDGQVLQGPIDKELERVHQGKALVIYE